MGYASYINQNLSGNEEPLITHADHYKTNRAYGVGAYSKGEVLVEQLGAVMGTDADEAMRRTSKLGLQAPWPQRLQAGDGARLGLELDWYFQYMMHTTDA